MDFQKLMAQATAVAKQQDAALAEKARRRRREEEQRRMQEAKAERERERLEQLRQERQKNERSLKEKKKRGKETTALGDIKKGKLSTTTTKKNSKSNAVSAALARLKPQTKKDMSFEELMKHANKLPTKRSDVTTKKEPLAATKKEERSVVSGKRPPASSTTTTPSHTPRSNSINSSDNNHIHNSNIYQRRRPTVSRTSNPVSATPSNMSARDKVRQMMRQPPQKLNTQKRDLRSVSEIQRDIRHRKGIYSDDEGDVRNDPRLLQNKQRSVSEHRYSSSRAPPAPPARHFPAGKRPAAASIDRGSDASMRRMPFMRPPPGRRRHLPQQFDEEADEEMDDFVVDDEEEEESNDYSAEIGRIFRYNKKRFRDEMYSDDDMEADAREVLREEKRSERIGRREDIEEEKRELERQKRLRTKEKTRP
ncbi:SPT2 chromatin protein-domain-containing protein [Zychaea mexicana]|uniref:SPT2 chromatin protein-domain-containing protein n=1 Tax=Zychaea mexicana TaxID=64656 RepID=UPI0022FDE4D2|nr:SPT2 chromatin protein-domain-containing protein [Zychaea mexicana]KAI9489790.1 SPT2 chromatin protein-domain-containing protein [Zychaea mexicana]